MAIQHKSTKPHLVAQIIKNEGIIQTRLSVVLSGFDGIFNWKK